MLLNRQQNKCALIYAFINILVEYFNLKKSIWPALGDKIFGKTKSTHYQNVAEQLLSDQEPYNHFIKTPKGQKIYGTSVGVLLGQIVTK